MGKVESALCAWLQGLRAPALAHGSWSPLALAASRKGKGQHALESCLEASPTSEDCSDFSPAFYNILVSLASDTILNALIRQCGVCMNP